MGASVFDWPAGAMLHAQRGPDGSIDVALVPDLRLSASPVSLIHSLDDGCGFDVDLALFQSPNGSVTIDPGEGVVAVTAVQSRGHLAVRFVWHPRPEQLRPWGAPEVAA